MPQLVAEAPFTYATKQLKAGDRFEASEKHANILKLAKKARDAAPDAAPDVATADEPAARRSGGYRRRDMRAQG